MHTTAADREEAGVRDVSEPRAPVVFVGAVTADAIALVPSFPEPDSRTVADHVVHGGGGPAATAAVAARRLGIRATVVGAVGDDPEAGPAIQSLRAEGVDTSAIATVPGSSTAASVVVVDRGQGSRAICTRPPAPLDVSHAAELIRTAEWVHADHIGWAPVRALLADIPEARRPRLSLDIGYPVDGFTAAGADLYVPPETALRARFPATDLDALMDAALADGARTVVVTRGADGCAAADATGGRWHAPAAAQEAIVSTLGAGDVFHGALLAAILRELSMPACLAYANTAAALSCRALDGRSAIPSHDEVIARIPIPT